jgi:hypothetical protein
MSSTHAASKEAPQFHWLTKSSWQSRRRIWTRIADMGCVWTCNADMFIAIELSLRGPCRALARFIYTNPVLMGASKRGSKPRAEMFRHKMLTSTLAASRRSSNGWRSGLECRRGLWPRSVDTQRGWVLRKISPSSTSIWRPSRRQEDGNRRGCRCNTPRRSMRHGPEWQERRPPLDATNRSPNRGKEGH